MNKKVIVYTDGSFNKLKPSHYGWAFVAYNDQGQEVYAEGGKDNKYLESWQIGGETTAVLKALEWFRDDKNFDTIEIMYDYAGLEHWALGTWKAKKAVSQDYHNRFNELVNDLARLHKTVLFEKVKGHSGITGNDRADKLANEALR